MDHEEENYLDPLSRPGLFERLEPELIIRAVEEAYSLKLDGSIQTYTSYVNRVYGLRDEDGLFWVAKFYRPGRWTAEQILQEHAFVEACQDREVPVVAPFKNCFDSSLAILEPQTSGFRLTESSKNLQGLENLKFCIFPRKAGRTFDADRDEDWLRLGRLIGRMHLASEHLDCSKRVLCHPEHSTTSQLQDLWDLELVHPDCRDEFFDLGESMLDRISPLFSGIRFQALHGDCHRGNVLDRAEEGLVLIDFDDMMQGPRIQDLWLMLPGTKQDSSRELSLLLEGYEEFSLLDYQELKLVEALRFMRMVHFLHWCSKQRLDLQFQKNFPSWGSKAFWIQEIGDFQDQNSRLLEEGI